MTVRIVLVVRLEAQIEPDVGEGFARGLALEMEMFLRDRYPRAIKEITVEESIDDGEKAEAATE